MVRALKRLVGIFYGKPVVDHGTVKEDQELINIQPALNTAMVVDLGENYTPACSVCGGHNLSPDPGGYYCHATDRYGAPLLCGDESHG